MGLKITVLGLRRYDQVQGIHPYNTVRLFRDTNRKYGRDCDLHTVSSR